MAQGVAILVKSLLFICALCFEAPKETGKPLRLLLIYRYIDTADNTQHGIMSETAQLNRAVCVAVLHCCSFAYRPCATAVNTQHWGAVAEYVVPTSQPPLQTALGRSTSLLCMREVRYGRSDKARDNAPQCRPPRRQRFFRQHVRSFGRDGMCLSRRIGPLSTHWASGWRCKLLERVGTSTADHQSLCSAAPLPQSWL